MFLIILSIILVYKRIILLLTLHWMQEQKPCKPSFCTALLKKHFGNSLRVNVVILWLVLLGWTEGLPVSAWISLVYSHSLKHAWLGQLKTTGCVRMTVNGVYLSTVMGWKRSISYIPVMLWKREEFLYFSAKGTFWNTRTNKQSS